MAKADLKDIRGVERSSVVGDETALKDVRWGGAMLLSVSKLERRETAFCSVFSVMR